MFSSRSWVEACVPGFVVSGLCLGVVGSAHALDSESAAPGGDESLPAEALKVEQDQTGSSVTGEGATDGPEGGARAEPTEEQMKAAFLSSLQTKTGTVDVGDDLAVFKLTDAFTFVGPEDAERVLQAWGNPPGSGAIGLVYPSEVDLFSDAGWAVVVTYTEDGHVEDDDAADMDFDELLTEMKEGAQESNAERKEQGFEAVELVGWAEPPHYDASQHKLFWAKELQFGDSAERTLNYAIRVLGRKGVLELNAVSTMGQFPVVKSGMGSLLSLVEFQEGNRYSDFDPKLDDVAAYGIGALVAGTLAAKAGLFKGLFALLLASKKLIVLGVIALGGVIKSVFFGKKLGSGQGASKAE